MSPARKGHFGSRLPLPLFAIACLTLLLSGHLALTFVVFVGVYVATKLEPRAGAADGKLMVGLAAFAPLALVIGALRRCWSSQSCDCVVSVM